MSVRIKRVKSLPDGTPHSLGQVTRAGKRGFLYDVNGKKYLLTNENTGARKGTAKYYRVYSSKRPKSRWD